MRVSAGVDWDTVPTALGAAGVATVPTLLAALAVVGNAAAEEVGRICCDATAANTGADAGLSSVAGRDAGAVAGAVLGANSSSAATPTTAARPPASGGD